MALSAGGRLEINVPELLQSPVLATASITGSDGRPFRGFSFRATVETEWKLHLGQTTVAGLPAGDWSVVVTAADGRRWETRARVLPHSTNRVTLNSR